MCRLSYDHWPIAWLYYMRASCRLALIQIFYSCWISTCLTMTIKSQIVENTNEHGGMQGSLQILMQLKFWIDRRLKNAWIFTKGSFLPPKTVMSVSSLPFQIYPQCCPHQLSRPKTLAMYSVLKVLNTMTIPVDNVLNIAKSYPITPRLCRRSSFFKCDVNQL